MYTGHWYDYYECFMLSILFIPFKLYKKYTQYYVLLLGSGITKAMVGYGGGKFLFVGEGWRRWA